jgi:hypothetical protein
MNRSVVIHHNSAWWRSHLATSRCTAGSVRRQRSSRGGKSVAWATPSGLILALSQLLPQQKAVSQHGADRMAGEPWPQPPLVLVPAQCTLGLFMALLHRVAAMGTVYQRLHGGRGRQIALIARALLRLSAGGPLSQQPAQMGLALRRQVPTSPRHELLAQPALAPRAPGLVRPGRRGSAASPWAARWTGGVPRRFRQTSQSRRAATT